MIRLLTIALAAILVTAAVGPPPAAAQEEVFSSSFLNPFPDGDVYHLEVIGDSLAEGAMGGLIEAMGGDTRLQIARKRRPVNGLMRSGFEVEMVELAEEFEANPPQIAVVMLGVWDRNAIRKADGKWVAVGAPEWRSLYGQRVDRLMKAIRKKSISGYWISLPNMRNGQANETAQIINDIVRERAYVNGLKFIDAYSAFADEFGRYSPYGPDVTGQVRLLRAPDGMHFSLAGNRKLAHFVERELRRDLQQARSERNIPLAGSEKEQARVNPERLLAKARTSPDATEAAAAGAGAPPAPGASQGAPVGGIADQKADNARISLKARGPSGRDELLTIEILRPAIPASVVALVTRKESPDKPSQMGDTIIDQIPGGLALMSSITPSGEAGGGRRRISPTQTPYFRILVKGERTVPKPGRADDVTFLAGSLRDEEAVEPSDTAAPISP